MFNFIKKLAKDGRGNVLAIAAACMPLVIGAAGLATDTIEWTLWKRQLQRAADSAAFAGAYDRANSVATAYTSTTPTAVCADIAINLHTWMNLRGTAPCTGTTGSYKSLTFPADSTYVTKQVTVTLEIQQALPFSSMFVSAAPVIQATATAGSVTYGGSPCMLALNSTGTAIDNSGNTTITAPTCTLYSDSASSNSAAAGGSSSVTAKAIAGVGGIASSNNWHVNSYLPYSPSLPDPLGPQGSNITPDPNAMNCTASAADKNTNWVAMKAAGINCFSSMSTNPHDVINVPANFGPIYINGGSVDFKGDFTCSGCSIVLTNKSTASNATIGTFSSNAQATNTISAPTSGTFKGIAVYQDRRATGGIDKINGGATNVISGVVYFPNDTLWINGSGNAVSLCAMWIANNLVFKGNSSIGISSASDAACASSNLPTGVTTTVRLIS